MINLEDLLKRMNTRGVSSQRVLAGSEIKIRDLRSNGYRPSIAQYRAVFRNILALSPPGVGLELGLVMNFADKGIIGYAELSSPTLRAAINLMQEYRPLAQELVFYSTEPVDGEWHIMMTPVQPMGEVLPFLIEYLFARSKTQIKMLAGVDVPFVSMEFAYHEPSYVALYKEIFQCPLHFGRDRNRVVIEEKYLDLPIVYSNPEVFALCEAQCAKLLKESEHARSIGADVRRHLIFNPGKYPTLVEMSEALRMSPATLQFRLREEGETYRDILNSLRRDLAIEYLSQTDLTPKEISYRLGFSNVHNFRRAFKVWTGFNPSYYQP